MTPENKGVSENSAQIS